MRMIASDGLWLHARADGPDGAPAVLLLNSLGTDLRMWDGVTAGLAARFRVIRFDKPGHGLSASTGRGLSMAQLAGHAADVLAAFGVARADVVGLSIGGQIAMELARTRPGQVGRLVLSNTAARIGSAQMWADRIAALQAEGIAAHADAVLERWFSARWRAANPGLLAGYRAMLSRTDLTGYLACCDALAAADFTETCRGLTRPALVIAGEADLATPPDLVRQTSAILPDARFAQMAGVGHLPCIEDEAAYLDLLLPWLSAAGAA